MPGARSRKKARTSPPARRSASPLERDEGRAQHIERLRRDLVVELPVRLVLRDTALVDADEVHAVPPELLELPGSPPELAASHRRGEVADVMPEPEQDVAERLDLIGPVGLGQRERPVCKDAVLVEQDAMRPRSDRIEVAFCEVVELQLGAVGQDHERHVVVAEILEEQRFAKRAHEGVASGDHVVVRVVAHDHAEIDVRVLVGLAPCARSAQEQRRDAIVRRRRTPPAARSRAPAVSEMELTPPGASRAVSRCTAWSW